MNIKFNDLGLQWATISATTLPKITTVLENGNFILGTNVKEFEDSFKIWNNNKFAIGVSNGTDGLVLAVSSLCLQGKSMFYVPANTYIATLLGVILSTCKNAEYKLIDCDNYFQIDMDILESQLNNDKNKYDNLIVMPVHLYGASANMSRLMKMKKKFSFKIIEDCSQSHGTITSDNLKVGNYGDVSVFSLYPGKNLGAAGDAGIIVTDDAKIHEKCLMLRNLGSIEKYKHEIVGFNSRLDTIQAVILNEKLKYMDDWNKKRNEVASLYLKNIESDFIKLPETPSYCNFNTYHIFPILTEFRNELMDYLSENLIPVIIHYPIPIEKTGAFYSENCSNKKTIEFSNKILSIPMHPFLSNSQVDYICEKINKFLPKK